MVSRCIGIMPCGWPTQTAVDSCLVKPTNQVCSFSLVVPVLPEAGRPSGRRATPLAVPFQTKLRP